MSNWMVTYNSDDLMHYGTKGHSGVYVRKNKKQAKDKTRSTRFSTDNAMGSKAMTAIQNMYNARYGSSQQGLKERNLSDREIYNLYKQRTATINNCFKALSKPAKKDFIKNLNYLSKKERDFIKMVCPNLMNYGLK